jgi:hypothetical protein
MSKCANKQISKQTLQICVFADLVVYEVNY